MTARSRGSSTPAGRRQLWARPPGFATLSRIILERPVSQAAANALYSRLRERLPGGWTPASIVREGTSGLTRRGVTRQKAAYACVALAERIERGELFVRHLGRVSNDNMQRQLIACHGIGPSTASVYPADGARRPDVWPPGDLALHKALSLLLGRQRPIASEEAIAYASLWAPYRAVAARILWCGYLGGGAQARSRARRRRGVC